MSYLHDINIHSQNEHTLTNASDIDMPDYDTPNQQTEALFVPLQSDFISKEELEGIAPFQNMFNQSSLSNDNEHNSSVLKPRSPWEDESYHLDNFIPFLTKSKKMKLSDISEQNLLTNSDSIDPQTTHLKSQELREYVLLNRTTGIIPDELISNSHQTEAEDSTATQYDSLSLLEEARMLLDKKSNANFTKNEFPVRDEEDEEARLYKQRPRLYPGYKPGKSFVDDLIWKEGATNCYPETDLTSSESYSLQHVHLLTQQISSLIEGEADNNRRIQAIKESYKDSGLSSLHENLDSTLLHSLDVLMECQNVCQRVSKLEEHASVLSRILVDKGVMKIEDNPDSD